tara:strand:+ start:1563 stop:1805 length:243 start_codon:yes stop_codon:yes gene_type:complete
MPAKLEIALENYPVKIKDVHIGESGKPCDIQINYHDNVRMLTIDIYNHGSGDHLATLDMRDGKVLQLKDDTSSQIAYFDE